MMASQTRSIAVGWSKNLQTLRINGSRLIDSIHSTCKYGEGHRYGEHPTETGMARLALSDDDKKVRHWFIEQTQAAGCKVTVDQMGNIFAVRPGKTNSVAPVYMGSHLDTQPTGGRYDGILGVMAGLEVLRTLNDNNYETEGPLGVVNWTNEEGARFPIVAVSSAVWAGSVPLQVAWNCKEISIPSNGTAPRTMKEELERIGFLGDVAASHEVQPIGAHFELHIEQGPILENEKRKIGVVTGAQAYRWFEVEVKGKDRHAGTTPLTARRDPILAASKMIVASNLIAKDVKGLVTTGVLRQEPGSINTIAHTVKFTLDVRHLSDTKLAEMVEKCREVFERIAKDDSEVGVQVEWTTLAENLAVKFDEDCVAAIEGAADDACAGLAGATKESKLWRHMTSGAGHDSCNVSKIAPSAMIFTQTRNGMSHTPDEYCSPEDCIIGTQVLLGAVTRYDTYRFEHGGL